MNRFMISMAAFLLVLASTATVLAKDGNSGHEGSGRGGKDRVRIEVRGNEANDDVNRVRIEARSGEDRVRIEARDAEEVEDELAGLEINGNTFEITGAVTAFSGGSVTIDGRTITINPSLVTNFEQEGTIEVGETIKVEGMVAADGALLAREIKADGIEVEEASVSGQLTRVNLEGNLQLLTSLFNQILALLRSLI